MKAVMLIFAQLLLLCTMLPVDSMTIHINFPLQVPNKAIPLTMVKDSVDDMYLGCNDLMMRKIKRKFFEDEKHNIQFAGAWNEAKYCAENKFKEKEQEDEALTKDHLQAICVYTADKVYTEFNAAVRTSASVYGSSFQFHSLHYLLTSAIQILNKNNYYCHTTYRRASVRFTGTVNSVIRFGSFTSSSNRTDLRDFGSETCFKIKTCSGAFLKKYSVYDDEAEVLIPPYEMFNITEIINGYKGKVQGLEDCKTVFVLESAGVNSNMNCKVA